MYDGLTLEYLAKLEHANRIGDPSLSRRAQIGRDLALLSLTDEPSGRGILPRVNLAIGRIGALFAMPRGTVGQA